MNLCTVWAGKIISKKTRLFWSKFIHFLELLGWNLKNHEKKTRTSEETATHKIKTGFRFWLWISDSQNILVENEIFFNLLKRDWWSKPYTPISMFFGFLIPPLARNFWKFVCRPNFLCSSKHPAMIFDSWTEIWYS